VTLQERIDAPASEASTWSRVNRAVVAKAISERGKKFLRKAI
jgi:hypothetical protein